MRQDHRVHRLGSLFIFAILITAPSSAFATEMLFRLHRSAVDDPDSLSLPPMERYVFGFYRKHPLRVDIDSVAAVAIQAEHMAHLQSMAKAEILVGAGPFLDSGELRGILIFRADSVSQVRTIAESDPAVRKHRLSVSLHPWWGPRGIGTAYMEEWKKNPEMKTQMVRYQFGLLMKGPAWSAMQEDASAEINRGHQAHVVRHLRSGALAAAGPFEGEGDIRGILFFALPSMDDARAIADADPAVRTGILTVEMHPVMVARGVLPRP